MLPCSVVEQQLSPGVIEVAAIGPVASMQAITNPAHQQAAQEVRRRLASVIECLGQTRTT